eukprot:TRINITY_DN1154_c0_g1_i13.p1 TRINITY_DN1154_c0_g1~~TRINITY_DN1154_c0_g1_i13.p1  ORF type:complete len:468 (-),score=56.07 TRINITY_DN1154_c0_g1_i13:164-1567(-)
MAMGQVSQLVLVALIAPAASATWHVIIDAGSTGSRAHLFWSKDGEPQSMTLQKIEPGLSDFVDNPEGALENIEQLSRAASKEITNRDARAENHRLSVPLLIRATAGMRKFSKPTQDHVYKVITESFNSRVAALLPVHFDLSILTLTGEYEAFYGFVAANYLAGAISSSLRVNPSASVVGVVDLGGGSTQVTFPLSVPEQNTKISLDSVSAVSLLGYGFQALNHKINATFGAERLRPCLFPTSETHGQATRCRELIEQSIWPPPSDHADVVTSCEDGPCPIESEKIVLPEGTSLIAVSLYSYTVSTLRAMTSVELDERPEDRILQPTIDQLKSGAEAFCNTPISELEEVAKATSGSDFNGSRCFQLNYIIVILTKLLAISPTANAVLYTTEMAGQDIDWPLGLYLDAQSREDVAQPGDGVAGNAAFSWLGPVLGVMTCAAGVHWYKTQSQAAARYNRLQTFESHHDML